MPPASTTPQDPQAKKFEKRVYIMDYFHGTGNGKPEFKIFEFEGNLAMARDESRRHCLKMGYRWLRTRPYIVNLRAQELSKEKADGGDWTEGSYEET